MPIAVLSSQVTKPTKSDNEKLVRIVKYLCGGRDILLTLSIGKMSVIKWAVDASYAVYPDFMGHSGGCMTWGRGCPMSVSTKQKTKQLLKHRGRNYSGG